MTDLETTLRWDIANLRGQIDTAKDDLHDMHTLTTHVLRMKRVLHRKAYQIKSQFPALDSDIALERRHAKDLMCQFAGCTQHVESTL